MILCCLGFVLSALFEKQIQVDNTCWPDSIGWDVLLFILSGFFEKQTQDDNAC